MKKLIAMLFIVPIAAFAAVAGFVTVSANGGSSDDVSSRIANTNFYTQAAYMRISSSGQYTGADTLSFTGVADQKTQVRVPNLFSDDTKLMLVHYTMDGDTMVIDKADLPAGTTSYTIDVKDDANNVTATQVKDGQTRSRTGYAINKYSEVLATTQVNA